MLIERLIKDNPKFHKYKGSFTSWAPHPDTLRFLYNLLTPGMSTLETGCGQTTVVFSIADTKHTCITPDPGHAKRVKQYCAKLGLKKNITFLIESSDIALPSKVIKPTGLEKFYKYLTRLFGLGKELLPSELDHIPSELDHIPSELDHILIDGAHRFPFPIIDWHYTAPKLRLGGILSVDDFKMPSVKILYDFLCIEEVWELIEVIHNTAFFRKLREPFIIDDWQNQKINLTFQGG